MARQAHGRQRVAGAKPRRPDRCHAEGTRHNNSLCSDCLAQRDSNAEKKE